MSDADYNNRKSESKEFCYERKCCCERDRPQYFSPNRTLLKRGYPGVVTPPLATTAGTNFAVASMDADTRRFRKPCIKLEFANSIVTTIGVLTLNLQIFEQRKNRLAPISVGPVWTFSRLVAVTESNVSTFFVCDCDICGEEYCNYSMAVTATDVATVGVTSISNATLSVIIVNNGYDCK